MRRITLKLKKQSVWTAFVVMAMFALLPLTVQAADGNVHLEIGSDTIEISTFYNGTTLYVHGEVPVDADVVLEVSGPRHDVHLKEKGKVAGFLWMNKTDVSLENTPAVYMVFVPSNAGANFLSPELGIGYKALLADIEISPKSEDKDFIFGEYVKLMEDSGVYSVKNDAITYGKVANGLKNFSATLTIPSKMGTGAYTVTAASVENGAVTGTMSKDLKVELKGFPAFISNLAFGHPLLFGILAVVIAIGAGLLVGTLFKGGGGAH